jgi:archaellum component FlaG (FlaF/FlaG flagellin family)
MNKKAKTVLTISTIIIMTSFAALLSFAAIMIVESIKDANVAGNVETIIKYFVDFFKDIIDSVPV